LGRAGARSWFCGRNVGVKPELLATHTNHVRPSQQLRALDAGAVHPDAVRAVVGNDVPVVGWRDRGVLPRHLGLGHDDVTARFPTERDSLGWNLVFLAVHQRHEATTGRSRRSGRTGALRGYTGDVTGRYELRRPDLLVLGKQDLVPADFHLVAVNQRSGLDQGHAVDSNCGVVAGPTDHNLIVCQQFQHRLDAKRGVVGDADVDARAAAHTRLPELQCVLFVVDLNDGHGPSARRGPGVSNRREHRPRRRNRGPGRNIPCGRARSISVVVAPFKPAHSTIANPTGIRVALGTCESDPYWEVSDDMSILAWIVLGLIAGAVAKAIMPGRDPGGVIVTMLLGIVGAFLGGFLGNLIAGTGLNGFSLWSIVLAVVGAILLLWIYRVATRHRTTTPPV
jgi:uncharacterized membrane protein YeaQ/YmgE (transglycosylase-associated protein family)